MATLRYRKILSAVNGDSQEEYLRNYFSGYTNIPRVNEEYITPDSEEIEGKVTKKLSQEIITTKCRFLGALSKLDYFLLNSQVGVPSGTAPGSSRNYDRDNQ